MLNPNDGWRSKPVAMAVGSRPKSLLCLLTGKRVVASLIRSEQKQQVAWILSLFHHLPAGSAGKMEVTAKPQRHDHGKDTDLNVYGHTTAVSLHETRLYSNAFTPCLLVQ